MTEQRATTGCICERLWRGRYHSDRDCPQRFEAFIIGNVVDGYEVGVSDEGDIMEGRAIRRHNGPIRTERKARKIAEKMLADERKRRQTDVRERVL